MSQQFKIGHRTVGIDSPCFVIAEIGQAHDGSLGAAHAYIDAVAKAGVDAVKFQTHIADAESTAAEIWRVPFSRQDSSRHDYWKRMEFSPEQWAGLKGHAEDNGLVFLSSPFSSEAVVLLEKLGVPAWKVSSGEIQTRPMLEQMARTGKPILLSSGMSSWEDLDEAVGWIQQEDTPIGIFQCTTAYPCPPEQWGLNVLAEIRKRFRCPVGFSDHSGGCAAGLAAAALGADLLEVHVTFSRQCFGPDTPASVTIEELRQLAEGVREIETALTHPIEKDLLAQEMGELRTMFGKSVVAVRDLPAGHRVGLEDLAFKKPGTGIPAAHAGRVEGRCLLHGVPENHFFDEGDFVPERSKS